MAESTTSWRGRLRRSALPAVAVVAALVATAVTPASASTASAQVRAEASSSRAGSTASALADGRPAAGQLGAEWSAAADDASPWVQLSWAAPRRIASVQVFGSTANAFDPKQSTAAALYGTLRFSDGSSVVVSGVAPGAGMPTTVAFAPRSTSSVRFEIRKQITWAPVALREFTAYGDDETPPRWGAPSSSPTYRVSAPAAQPCSASTKPVGSVAAGRLALVCPAAGTAVADAATVVVSAPVGEQVTAWVDRPGSGVAATPLSRLGTAVSDQTGRASLSLNLRSLPSGPVVVKLTATGSGPKTLPPVYAQLVKTSGSALTSPGAAPAGMSLRYADEFDTPLSISQNGWNTDYAALKPEPWGGSQFGMAAFANPAWGAGTLATLPGGYLRIRAQPIGEFASKATWKQPHVGGLLSSQRFGGSGFSAQYGYFEARILGAPGPGAWPAFWMMNSESGTSRTDRKNGELDAVELYGHNTTNACHSTHAWGQSKDADGKRLCPNLAGDWAAQWHTYGARVIPGGAEFYVDGVKVGELDQLARTDEPFFFMLDLATAGGWPVDLSATGDTTDMYVDWVRVYT